MKTSPRWMGLACAASLAVLAVVLAVCSGPSLAVAPVLTWHLAGALPSRGFDVLAQTDALPTKGWVTVSIPDVRPYEEVVLELILGPLPATAHLHMTMLPLKREGLASYRGVPPFDGTLPRWAKGSGDVGVHGDVDMEAAAQVVTKPRLGSPQAGFEPVSVVHFRNGRHVIGSDVQVHTSGAKVDLGDFQDVPSATAQIGIMGTCFDPGGSLKPEYASRTAAAEPGGEEFEPGDKILLTLSAYLRPEWDGVRIALACYHRNSQTGQDEAFSQFPTDHAVNRSSTIAVTQWDYPNDPYVLWGPWKRNGRDPFWLSHDSHLLHAETRPPMERLLGGTWDGVEAPGFRKLIGDMYAPSAYWDWDRVLGEETAQWWLAWVDAMFNLGKWKQYQYTQTAPRSERGVPQSHGFLASWLHHAADMAFDGVPYFWDELDQVLTGESVLRETLPPGGSQMLVETTAGFAEQGAVDVGGEHLTYAGLTPTTFLGVLGSHRAHGAGERVLQTAPNWPAHWALPVMYGLSKTALALPDSKKGQPNTPDAAYLSRWSGWPGSWETEDEAGNKAYSLGVSVDQPIQSTGRPLMWGTSLPGMFGQERVVKSPEIPWALFHSLAAPWGGMLRELKTVMPVTWGMVTSVFYGFLENSMTELLPELEGFPGSKPLGVPDAWSFEQYFEQLFMMSHAAGLGDDVSSLEMLAGTGLPATDGAPAWGPIHQPVYEVATAHYILGRIKVMGRRR